MMMAPVRAVGKAAMDRVLGLGPGPVRAAVASMVTGGATALITYKLLRGDLPGSDEDSD